MTMMMRPWFRLSFPQKWIKVTMNAVIFQRHRSTIVFFVTRKKFSFYVRTVGVKVGKPTPKSDGVSQNRLHFVCFMVVHTG